MAGLLNPIFFNFDGQYARMPSHQAIEAIPTAELRHTCRRLKVKTEYPGWVLVPGSGIQVTTSCAFNANPIQDFGMTYDDI